MNMHNLRRHTAKLFILLLVASFAASGCKKKEEFTDIYELDGLSAVPNSTGKIKLKTDEQYVSILYANLYQKGITTRLLSETTDAIYSVGDKQIAHESIVAKFMADPLIKIPTNQAMRADLDKFLEETYKRFFVRNISEAERAWFKNYITVTPEVTVEFVYTAFAISTEYQYY